MDLPYWLIPLGFALGTFGTLIGAGGGFVLAPALLLLYPHDGPDTIACISLAVVFFNAASGSIAYARMGRIDYKSGLLFALATIPGSIVGALTTASIPRRGFDAAFGIVMVAVAAYLALQRNSGSLAPRKRAGRTRRMITEKGGATHEYSYDLRIGMPLSLGVGYVSSVLGIGGGIVHVPVLARLLNFPVHIATATSHFVLAIMAFTGTVVHIASGSFANGGVNRTILLSVGIVVGAQLGARLSSRVHGVWIIRSLAIALGLVGARIFIMAL